MDGAQVCAVQGGEIVDGVADDVEEAALDLGAGGNGDGTLEAVDAHSALETVGALHGHAAHGVLADVLLHLEDEGILTFTFNFQGRVDRRDDHIAFCGLAGIKDYVHDRADYLRYFSVFLAHVLL